MSPAPVTILSISAAARNQNRLHIALSDGTALDVSEAVARQRGLQPGQELSPEEIEALHLACEVQGAVDAALLLLRYRPRSQAELAERLRLKGFSPKAIEETLSLLRGQGVVDDAAFARWWVNSRQSFHPQARALVLMELRRKGVNTAVAREALQGFDDEEAAYMAGQRRLAALPGLDSHVFREKLASYLHRRGFPWDVIHLTMRRLQQDLKQAHNASI